MRQLGELRDFLTEEELAQTEVLALAPDNLEELQMMVERVAEEFDGYQLQMGLLSDPGGAIIGRYGLLNEDDPRERPIPHPTVYVIDRDGRVRWQFTETDYTVRPDPADVQAALRELLD